MKRSKADAALTRDAVLDAARLVFERKGYASTTMEDIARAARVTRGAVYHHFADKAALYQTLLLESGRRSKDLIPAAIAEGGPFSAVLARIFVRQLQQIDEDPRLRAQAFFALRGDFRGIDGVREHIAETHAASMAMLVQAFAEAQAGGVVRTDLAPRDLARAFSALQNGLLFLSSLPGQEAAIRESAAALAAVLGAGFSPPKP